MTGISSLRWSGLPVFGKLPNHFLTRALGVLAVEVAGDDQGRVARHVPLLVEADDVIELGRLEILVLADDQIAVGVAFRVEQVGDREPGPAVRLVVVALPALVADHVDLVLQAGPGEERQEVAHAVALDPQRGLEVMGGHHLEVVGAVEVGRAVGGRAEPLEDLEVLVLADVLRALEEHVLEQVSEAAPPRHLVAGADVVPDVDRDQRDAVVLVEDDLETVVELVALELDLGVLVLAGCGRRRRLVAPRPAGQEEEQGGGRRDRDPRCALHGRIPCGRISPGRHYGEPRSGATRPFLA